MESTMARPRSRCSGWVWVWESCGPGVLESDRPGFQSRRRGFLGLRPSAVMWGHREASLAGVQGWLDDVTTWERSCH